MACGIEWAGQTDAVFDEIQPFAIHSVRTPHPSLVRYPYMIRD